MATLIERAAAVGINEEQAQSTIGLLGEAAFEAALKKKEAEQKKAGVDYVVKFKETYAEAYAAAESTVSALKQHIADFIAENADAKIAFDSEHLVKSTKNKRGSLGKTREKVQLAVIAHRYAGNQLSYNSSTVELLADGKVKAGETTHDDPNAWMRSVATAARPGVWYNVIKIDTGNGAPVSMAKAYTTAKNTAALPAVEPATNGKKK